MGEHLIPQIPKVWNVFSDHKIKQNIKKLTFKKSWDNFTNINLFRLNYIDAYSVTNDRKKLGFIVQQIKSHWPKAIKKQKQRLDIDREIPELSSVDNDQINMCFYQVIYRSV